MSTILVMSEHQLQDSVINLAQTLGYRVVHFRPAHTAKGWRTAVQGDGVGFPDLLLLRGDRGIAVELKADRVKDIPVAQIDWLAAFAATGWETYVWRPAQWIDEIKAVLE